MINADFILSHAGQLLCVDHAGLEANPRRGSSLGEIDLISDGAVAAREGVIVWVGATDRLAAEVQALPEAARVDAGGQVVTPGLIDAHTHPVFAATRPAEFAMRSAGRTYQDIAAAGGGIVRSVADTRSATLDDLVTNGRQEADRMLAFGTTTAEAKSGYGLDLINELKMLEAIHAISASHAIDWVPTVLAAHSIPPEHKKDPEEYVRIVIDEILPQVVAKGLAEFSDVFLEEGVFDHQQTERIQSRARSLGLGLKFHVDQLTPQRGTELAVAMGAVSADHLEFISSAGVVALAESDTIGVMLPGTAYFLDSADRPPVRKMIDAGAALALATDVNPGSNMCESMPMAVNQACVLYKMSPEEALVAATRNAAFAIARGDRIGSIGAGKQCDLVVWETQDYRELAYHYGVNLAAQVIKNGDQAV